MCYLDGFWTARRHQGRTSVLRPTVDSSLFAVGPLSASLPSMVAAAFHPALSRRMGGARDALARTVRHVNNSECPEDVVSFSV